VPNWDYVELLDIDSVLFPRAVLPVHSDSTSVGRPVPDTYSSQRVFNALTRERAEELSLISGDPAVTAVIGVNLGHEFIHRYTQVVSQCFVNPGDCLDVC
jgi:hypothetical protein